MSFYYDFDQIWKKFLYLQRQWMESLVFVFSGKTYRDCALSIPAFLSDTRGKCQ